MVRLHSLRRRFPVRPLRRLAQAAPLLLAAALPAAHAETHSWTSGAFEPGVTAPNPIPVGDTLALSSVSLKVIDTVSVENQGRITWINDGNIRLQAGGALVNSGEMERIGDTGSVSMFTGAGGGSFTNSGWVINTGAGLNLALAGGTLVNTGTFDNRGGTFVLPTGFTSSGTLMGNGFSIAGSGLVNTGILAPGSSGIGNLQLSNSNSFAQSAAGTLAIDITSAIAHDLLDVNGSGFGDATLGGTLALRCFGACSMAVGEEITVLRAARSITGQFDQVSLNGFATGAFEVLYEINAGTADDFVRLRVTQAVSAVPEPAAVALWLAGLVGVAGLARRRRARPA